MLLRRRLIGFAVTVALGLAACASGNPVSRSATRNTGGADAAGTTAIDPVATAGSTATPRSPPPDSEPAATSPGSFGWASDGVGLERGSLQVPLDYGDPSKGTITLAIERHAATDPSRRIGSLLVNPGGPGVGGRYLAQNAEAIYGPDLLDRFDIVAWDPRGTGASTPAVDCTDDYDGSFGLDSSPDTPAEQQALVDAGTAFGAACEQKDATLLPYVDTVSSARDIDSIRTALGEQKISYFGFSYGSQLGATWATLFPTTVRAAVLDGAIDPTASYLQQNLEQAAGFEAAFDTFLQQCSADPSCAFYNGGHAAEAYDALAASIDAKPIQVSADRTPVTNGVLAFAVSDALYLQSSWPALEKALADAQNGDGTGLLALFDEYYKIDESGGRSSSNEYEAYLAIQCVDHHGSTGPADLFSHEAEFAAAAPRLGRGWMAELTFCSVWPVPSVPAFTITGKDAGPIVVVGTTGDPATPLASSRKMADALEDGRLVIVQADQHTGYGVNECVDQAVDDYLVDPTRPPADGLSCR